MRRPAAISIIALALGAICLAPQVSAQDPGRREEGPREIEKCQTIDKPGSYKLVNDLTSTGASLSITASFVSIDLAGFTISGPGNPSQPNSAAGIGIEAGNDTTGIAVRNGSIVGFRDGVILGGDGSIVEGLRVFGSGCPCFAGILANGIVRGNTVLNVAGFPGEEGVGITATGIITGNYAVGSRGAQYEIGQGSTVIGNTAVGGPVLVTVGFLVQCPSNVTDNTAINNERSNLVLNGNGCNNTNNVAP